MRIERPRSEDELARAVARAASEGLPVRVAGSGHSFTDTACTDGVLVDIGALDRVLEADRSSGLVTVEAGITLHELGSRLADLGLAMENQGDIDAQTLAGAISTATHGTGATYRNISSQVEAVRLVTAAGAVLDIGADEPDLLGAARVGVGALGAISAVTLRAVPIFTLERRDEPMPLGPVLDDFDGHADGADHFELYVFPHTDVALTRTSTRSDREPEPGNVRVEVVQERLVENGALAVLGAVTGRLPRSIPRVNRTLIKAMTPSVKVDRSHRVYATRRDVRFTEMEYAIPREHGPEALRRVLETIERRQLPIAFPIEMRVVRGDDAPLSTAHGARQRVHRGAPVPRPGVRDLLPRRRGHHGLLRRPSALGQAPLPVGGHAARALPAVGRLAGRPRAAGPGPHVRQRLHAAGAGGVSTLLATLRGLGERPARRWGHLCTHSVVKSPQRLGRLCETVTGGLPALRHCPLPSRRSPSPQGRTRETSCPRRGRWAARRPAGRR